MKNTEAVGKITWLMGHSDQHCDWTVDDLHRLIIPPVALQQFRIWQVDEHPVGLMTWALFNEETEAGYLDGSRKIQPDDWNAGDRLWLVDFILFTISIRKSNCPSDERGVASTSSSVPP